MMHGFLEKAGQRKRKLNTVFVFIFHEFPIQAKQVPLIPEGASIRFKKMRIN